MLMRKFNQPQLKMVMSKGATTEEQRKTQISMKTNYSAGVEQKEKVLQIYSI